MESNKEILFSFIVITRKRTDLLRTSIECIFSLARYPEKIEIFIGFDSDDFETLHFVKRDPIIEKFNNISCYMGPRVGFCNNSLFAREILPLTSGKIIVPWADDNKMSVKYWDEIFIPYMDKVALIGWKARWAATRRAIEEYEWVRDFFTKPHRPGMDTLLYQLGVKENIYINTSAKHRWWRRMQPDDEVRREGSGGGWKLKDESILNNFKLEKVERDK